MKKTAIIKASLASLVIGTGLFTSTAQASEISLVRHTLGLDQKPKQTQQNTNVNKADREDKNVLLGYYTQQTTELTNLTGYTKDIITIDETREIALKDIALVRLHIDF